MKWSHPKVFPLGHTTVNEEGIKSMLDAIGADGSKWVNECDVKGNSEMLVEVAGRLCYKSFEPGLNPNVTQVREDSKGYFGNILDSGHGSVLEHASVSFGFIGVSRVFTHEIVRHRTGTAYSQESLRYVRLDDLDVWFPQTLNSKEEHFGPDNSGASRSYSKGEIAQREMFDGISSAEGLYKRLGEIFGIEGMKDFNLKKKLTSAFRRIAPIGLGTNIMVTANHRAWRHIIEVRTSIHAEEELRLVIGWVAEMLKNNHPNIYQDMEKVMLPEDEDPLQIPVWQFKNSKV